MKPIYLNLLTIDMITDIISNNTNNNHVNKNEVSLNG